MKEILGVFLGGAVGSVLRFTLGQTIQNLIGKNFPWGILLVNIAGCFLMGLLTILLVDKFDLSSFWKVTLIAGFLGGFTTFSGFTIDTINLFRQGFNTYALLYIFISLFLCLFATWFGMIFLKFFK